VNIETLVHVKKVDEGIVGLEVSLPNAPPLLLIKGSRGFIMCGYLNISVADRLGLAAARVVGVRTVEDMLEKNIVEVTAKARELGIKEGMKVREALKFIV